MFHDGLMSLRAAAEFAPANIPLRLTLAQTLFSENMLQEAEKEYQDIIEVAPYSTEAKCGLAKVCIAKSDFNMAVRIFQEVCNEQDLRPEFRIVFAKLLLRTQQADEARIQYQLATSMDENLKEPGLEKLFN